MLMYMPATVLWLGRGRLRDSVTFIAIRSNCP